jgi:hypothetical protein
MEAVGTYGNHLFRMTLSAPSETTVCQLALNFSAKEFFAPRANELSGSLPRSG